MKISSASWIIKILPGPFKISGEHKAMKTIEISGKNHQIASSLMECFKKEGYQPAAGGTPVDMFVYIIDVRKCTRFAYSDLLNEYQTTAINLLETVAGILPRLEKGEGKRLCFITRLSSSINLTGELTDGYEQVVTASCNMGIRILFNRLRPEGYTFRLYGVRDYQDPGEYAYIADYFMRNRCLEPKFSEHSDENRLIMRDRFEREYPW
jgi:hypothetical protein